jgi:hypothetical protein
MPFVKCLSSQHAHYDAVACILNVRDKPFGILVLDDRESSAYELLEFATQRWWTLPSIPGLLGERACCSMVTLGDRVYVIGGISSNRVHSFQFGTSNPHNEWHTLPNLQSTRCYPAAAAILEGGRRNDCIYVFGGRNDQWQELNSVECYTNNEWTAKASFQIPRMAATAVSIIIINEDEDHDGNHANNRIAIMGGYDGSKWLTSVELYDTTTDSWISNTTASNDDALIPDMPLRVAFPKAVLVGNDQIVVLGTSMMTTTDTDTVDEESSSTVIQNYNLTDKKWTIILSSSRQRKLVIPLEGCAVTSKLSTIYIIGGRDLKHQKSASKQVLLWHVEKPLEILDRVEAAASTTKKIKNKNSNEPDGGSASASYNQAVPPMVNAASRDGGDHQSFGSLLGVETVMTATTSSVRSLHSANSQKPSKVEEDVETTTLTEPIAFQDSLGMEGQYEGNVVVVVASSASINKNRPHGKGQIRWDLTGDVYDGEWRHGVRQGYGRIKYATGDVFEGWFVNDYKMGRGTYQWPDGRSFEGMYKNDRAEDPNGTLTWKNGTMFVGSFIKGQRTGKGVIRFPDNVRYKGEFANGKYDGFGTCNFQDGRVYTGHWRKGKAHGQGKLTEANGTVRHDGEWKHDAPVLPS